MTTIVKFDPFSASSECHLLDMKTGASSYGILIQIKRGSIRFIIGNEKMTSHPYLIKFLDPTSSDPIGLYIRKEKSFHLLGWSDFILCHRMKYSVKSRISRVNTRNPRFHRARICSKKNLPQTYQKLYERSISDGYV